MLTCKQLYVIRNADFELKNAIGYTPLMVAIAGGKGEVVLHMLQAIKRVKSMKSHREILNLPAKNNKTILQWAIESDYTVLVEVSKTNWSLNIIHITKSDITCRQHFRLTCTLQQRVIQTLEKHSYTLLQLLEHWEQLRYMHRYIYILY